MAFVSALRTWSLLCRVGGMLGLRVGNGDACGLEHLEKDFNEREGKIRTHREREREREKERKRKGEKEKKRREKERKRKREKEKKREREKERKRKREKEKKREREKEINFRSEMCTIPITQKKAEHQPIEEVSVT
ncbi:hypothetical protein PMIN04_004988 [Paraphaeosphaeria minitans]